MSQTNPSRDPQRNGHPPEQAALLADGAATGLADAEEIELLRGENAALRAKVDDLEQLLALASQEGENRWLERQREYESLLDDKSEVIRGLHQKMTELRDRANSHSGGEPSADKSEDIDEVTRLKRELEEQRLQMEQDEEAMMAQMRQMEMALAKDRAEMARQRSELQRLHGELKHELEAASRDGGLRDRLTALQRRAGASLPARSGNQDTPAAEQPPEAQQGKNGLLRRIFGSGQ
jgi:hypothetical protein